MDNTINHQQPIFDETVLLQRLMDDRELEKEIVRAFLFQTPGHIHQLKHYVRVHDAINARLQAHTIRGAAANLSAGTLQAAAQQVEECSQKGDLAGCMTYIYTLETEFDLFVKVIETSGLLQPIEENTKP